MTGRLFILKTSPLSQNLCCYYDLSTVKFLSQNQRVSSVIRPRGKLLPTEAYGSRQKSTQLTLPSHDLSDITLLSIHDQPTADYLEINF